MFDIDSGKLLIVAVLALIVIGPKELPRVLRQVGQAVGKMRRMATEFQGQFMDAMKEADIADIRKELNELNSAAALDVSFDPVRDVQSELNSIMAPAPSISADAVLPSPTQDFALPSLPQSVDVSTTALAEGIAPVAEVASQHDEANADVEVHKPNGGGPLQAAPAKRKVLVKRRRSSFNVLRQEEAAYASGEPLKVHRRAVRAKPFVSPNGPIS